MRYYRLNTVVVLGCAFPLMTLLLSTGCSAPMPAKNVLVDSGQARCSIVFPTGTEKGRVLTAIHDLAGYLGKMSGAKIPLRWDIDSCPGFRIMIGSTALSPVDRYEISEEKVGFDGFIIKSVPGGVVIAGRTPQGTANGVYHFAEEVLGVHWYTLEENAPICPEKKTIEIPRLDLTVKPDFAWRGQFYSIITKYLPAESRANRDQWWTFNRLWGISANVYHSFGDIVLDSMFAAHPEYFALIDGKRTRGNVSVQRCLSNPDVVKLAAAYSAEQFEKNPDLRFTSLSSNDGGGWCQCDACKAMGPTQSHRSLAFCSKVAELNESRYPNRGYAFYAYQGTLDPPLDMKAHRNVLPMIAPMGKCNTHPIDSECPGSILKRRVYKGWQQVAGRIAWHPYLNGGRYCTPGVLTHTQELRFVRDCGSIGGFREHTAAPQSNWAMLNWMEVKLMWDADQDAVKLRRQFIEGYYGPAAADAVERVYDSMETSVRTQPIGPRADGLTHNFMTPGYLKPLVAACRTDIDNALRIAQGEKNANYRRRIARDMGALLGKLPSDLEGLLKE